MNIDPRTLLIFNFTAALLTGVGLLLMARGNSYFGLIRGVPRWIAATFTQALGWLLFSLHQIIPSFVASVVGSEVHLLALALYYHALCEFNESPDTPDWAYLFAASAAIPITYFFWLAPDPSARQASFSLASAVLLAASARCLLWRAPRNAPLSNRLTGSIMLLCAAVMLVRGLIQIWFAPNFEAWAAPATGLRNFGNLTFFLSVWGSAFGFVLMCNDRHVLELGRQALIAEKTGIAVFMADQLGRIEWVNAAFSTLTGFTLKEARGKTPVEILTGVSPTDGEERPPLIDAEHVFNGFEAEFHATHRGGGTFWCHLKLDRATDRRQHFRQYIGVLRDTSAEKRRQRREASRNQVLTLIAKDTPQQLILETLVRGMETQHPGMLGSILLLDTEGLRLRTCTAPSLPAFYTAAIDGTQIGPKAGSCGTAAFTAKRVIVSDIQSDPLWEEWKDVADRADLCAAWSEPILSASGRVLGAFAVYHRRICSPTANDLEMLSASAQLAAITIESRLADENLKATVALLTATIESTADGIVVVDTKHRISRFNARFLNMWRLAADDIKNDTEFRSIPKITEQLVEPIRYRQRILDFDLAPDIDGFDTVNLLDGRIFERYSRPNLIDGVASGRVWSFRDVTARRHAETALRASEERLRRALEATQLSLWDYDVHSGRVYLSEAWSELLGGPSVPTTTTVHALRDLVPAEDLPAIMEAMLPTMRGQTKSYRTEHRVRRADGETIWIVSEGQVVERDQSGRALRAVGTNRDVTDRRRADELRAARDAAELASRTKSTFLASMSHELRTPLNSIQGFAQLLEYDPAIHQNDATQKKVRYILSASRHLLALIDDILDLSRIEAGVMTLSLAAVDADRVARETVDLSAPQAEVRGINVSLHYQTADNWVHADHTRLRQVVANLLSNAIKYNRAGGRVDLLVGGNNDEVSIAVSDTGAGLTELQLESLFQPFNRLGAETSNTEGTGIGLVIVKQLVESMGGRIVVQSTAGAGSTFSVLFPRASAPVANSTSVPQHELTTSVAQELEHFSVLYIEDNVMNTELLRETLALNPALAVQTAASGSEGLALAFAHRPDLVLVDINLPDIDGYEVLKRLRAHASTMTVPCFALSAAAMESDAARIRAAGFNEYVTKPFDVADLLQKVNALLHPARHTPAASLTETRPT